MGVFISTRQIEMSNTILVGAQWGDEGKGKIIDFMTEQADIVVRALGGANAATRLLLEKPNTFCILFPLEFYGSVQSVLLGME